MFPSVDDESFLLNNRNTEIKRFLAWLDNVFAK